ncbi:MAG: M48 family metallopeptidase [Colwellia sp.]|nr:M48 family metallopeptidase [Colwellia sp.]MCW9080348.1 M48 family metallopeptidase [Colwellia sp.]
MIDYQVVRSARRKTLSLQVKQGKVLVRAPYYVETKIIYDLVQKKSAWLRAKLKEQLQVSSQCCCFNQDDKLFYLGRLTNLHISFARKADTFLIENASGAPEFNIVLAKRYQDKLNDEKLRRSAVKKQLERYFKQQVEAILSVKVKQYSKLTQLKPKSIKIRQYSARWGSCNSNGELSFNYLMMMLPDYVINYIVVHELCHLRYLNHSDNFWQLVAEYFPQYLQAKQWLKDRQSQLLWRLP